jgi:NADH:ubiquinone oxidoreductase subunit E
MVTIHTPPTGSHSLPAPSPDGNGVQAILQKYNGRQGGLIAILGEIQLQLGCLPEEALRAVSEKTGRSLVDVYGIATFYRSFSLKPRGKHHLCVCLGTACHVRGAPRIAEEFQRQLGIRPGETTPDGEFSLETVNCLGACALGPMVVIDGRYFSKVRESKVRQLLDQAQAGFVDAGIDQNGRRFPLSVRCPRCNQSLMDTTCAIDGYPSIRVSVLGAGRQERLRLSSLYGSNRLSAEHDIPRESLARFFCPHCHEELTDGSPCPACEAPLVPLLVEGGGTLQLCSRRGCEKQRLNLV